MKGVDEAALSAAIDELQRLAEDYRDLEKLMNAPLRFNYPPEVTLMPRIDSAELAESVAQQERQRLGLGDQPVIYLRNALEWDVGLRIFYSGSAFGYRRDVRLHGRPRRLHSRQQEAPTGAAARSRCCTNTAT